MKEKKFNEKKESIKETEAPKAEIKYTASWGHNGKRVSVACRKAEDGKFVGLKGEEIPEWADIETEF